MSTEINAFTMVVRELDKAQATSVSEAFKEDPRAQHCFWDAPFTDPQSIVQWSTKPDIVLLADGTNGEILGLSWQYLDLETTTAMKGLCVWIFPKTRHSQPGLSAALVHTAQESEHNGTEAIILDTVVVTSKSGPADLHASAAAPTVVTNSPLGASGIRHY